MTSPRDLPDHDTYLPAPGPARAVVHLDRIGANLRAIREHIGADRRILLPVKADAYGHGAVAVSRYVQREGLAEWLGIATVGEGEQLRAAGVELPVLKLSPCLRGEWARAFTADITVCIESEAEATLAQQAAARRENRDGPVPVHLKVDTGMRRVGVDAPAAGPLAEHIATECPDLRVQGVFTHFAVSDGATPEEIAFTQKQTEQFRSAVAAVAEKLGYLPALVHAANSGGVLAHPETWGNMVRPGIMSYGYYPDTATPRTVALAPALEWRAPLLFVKKVAAGETVSYGRTWTAPRETCVGTIPVGYADGYRRALSNTARVLLRGREYPVVGRVCMDQMLVDLGAGTDAVAGDEVVLLGSDGQVAYTADDMAQQLGTISYEILTLLGARVRREYSQG